MFAAPLRKRERNGLSAKDAYFSKALDTLPMRLLPSTNKWRGSPIRRALVSRASGAPGMYG